jgi:hypothetical protein
MMQEIRTEKAWQQAREIAETIAKGVQEINQKSEGKAAPLSMSHEQFVDEMTTEIAKLYYRKFAIIA